MAESKAKDDASTLSFRPSRPAGGGGGSRLVVLESEGKDSPRSADGPSLQPQWLKSPSGKDLGRGPAGPPGYPGGDKPRWGKDPPPNRSPFGKEIEWRKPGGGADWDQEGEGNRAPDNRWRDEEREGGGQARAANGFRDRWQVDKGGEGNKWGGAEGGADHRRERWGDAGGGGENRKWGPNRWDADRDKEAPPARNKWGPEPDRDGGAPPGPRAPPEDNVFRRGNDPWRPSGRGRGGVDPPPTGFAIPPGGFARGRGRGRAPGFGGPPEQRPPIGAPPGDVWNHQTVSPAGGRVSERERAHRYSKEKMLEVLKKVRSGAGLKKPETSADVQEIVLKNHEEPFAYIPLDEEDKGYYESIRRGEPTRPPPRPTDAATPLQKDPAGRGKGMPRAGAPDDEKAEDNFFDAPALSAQRGLGGAQFERAAEARFADAERIGQPPRGRDDPHLWYPNEAPLPRKEEELVAREDAAKGAKPGDDSAGKDWRTNRFGEGDRAWRKPTEEKTPEKKAAPLTPPPPTKKPDEPPHRSDQVSSWRKGDEANKKPETPEKEAGSPFAAHLLPDDLLGGKDEPAAELWEGGEHENDEAYTEGGLEPPAEFWYKDPQGETQGPFAQEDIEQWLEQGFFTADLPVRRSTLPESAPFVPLGIVLPHLRPKPPRMPPGYEQKELEGVRPDQREAVPERSSGPGTGPEATREGAATDGRVQRTLLEAAAPQAGSWPQNHVTHPREVSKPQTPEQNNLQLRHASLRAEPAKAPAPETHPPPAEPPFTPHFPGAPDLSFLHSEEPRKAPDPLEQLPPQHPLFRGAPQRPVEQPPPAEQPFFPHPAFARGPGPHPNWPPQEQFPQPSDASELPPWLVGTQESARKGEQVPMPPPGPREGSMPFPPPAMPKEVFVHMGGNPEHYIAYLQEHQQLQARFMHRMHLQRQHSGLAQHAEGGAFAAGLPPHLQPPQQAHSLEQVEAEQRQRQRQREEAELQARLRQNTPPEQPPFGGAFPPDLLPPHLRFPGPEQPWPARLPFETPEQQFHQEMLRRQQDHEQQLRRSHQGGPDEARVQSELPPFLQGVLPRERAGGPPKEQSIPPELVQAVQDGTLPVEALAQYLTSLGIGGVEGGRNQGQEKPSAAKESPPEQGWTRAPNLNFEHQAMREEPSSRMGPSVEEQGRMAAWAAMQKGPQPALMSQSSGAAQEFGLLQGLGVQAEEERLRAQRLEEERVRVQRVEDERREKAHFEKLHQEHIAELRRQALQKPRGSPQSTAQQPPAHEMGPTVAHWKGLEPEQRQMEASLRDWVVDSDAPKTGPQVSRAPAQPAKEAPWTASAPKEKKSLLQIQLEEADRMAAERARHAAEEAARIAAGGYGAGQNGPSPWGGAGGASRPKTLKEIQEEEARQTAERNARTNVAAGGPVWGPQQGQATPPVVNRPEKLQARDMLAEQVIQTAAVSAPQTPPAVSAREEKKKRANEMTPPVRTITAEEELEFVEAGSGKKSKKKGAKGKATAAASKPAPAPTLMQSASPWAAEAAATRPSLRQLAAEVSADDTPPEYSSKSAMGPSLADFLPGLHQEEKPQQGPVWNMGAGGAKRMTLKEIQEAEKKEAERRAVVEKARQAAMPRPVQTQAPSGAPWQRPTPSNTSFPAAPAQRVPNSPPQSAPASAPHAEDDDDLFWDYGKDATITIGNVPREPEPPAFPTLGGPPKSQSSGNWATPKPAVNAGYKQVATPANVGARTPAQGADFPTLAPTGAAATATGAKNKKRGAAAPEPAAAPAFTPATAKAGAEFRKWCQQWTRKITGQDDLTLLDFCMTLPSASDVGDYITEYWGNKPEVAAFQGEFLKRRSAMPASVLQAEFFAGDATGERRTDKATKGATSNAADVSNDAQKATAAAEAAGKKKGKKAKKILDNSLLGFSVHSSRINMGTIESAADAV